jgi:hypothetical protein
MVDPLEGARWKVRRAWEHLDKINAELLAFFNLAPYVVVPHRDGEHRWRILIHVRQEPPPHIALQFGDAAHNIRSALDHLAQVLTGSSSNRQTQWPICDTPAKWDTAIRRLVGVDKRFYDAIRARQPFANPTEFGGLTILRELDDADKHRVLLFAVAYSPFFEVSNPPNMRVVDRPIEPVYVEEGAMLCAVEGEPPSDMQVNVHSSTGYTVSFGVPPLTTDANGLLEISWTVMEIIDCFAAMIS